MFALPGHVTRRNPVCGTETHDLFLKKKKKTTASVNRLKKYFDESMTNGWRKICGGIMRLLVYWEGI